MNDTSTVSVLLPTRKRPLQLARCLKSLAYQTRRPNEVLVVWQAEDVSTRDLVEALRTDLPFPIIPIHLIQEGIVPAENIALSHASGGIVALIDDDAEAPPQWLERILEHFADPVVGAVGGPAVNYHADGTRFSLHTREPIGVLPWHGFPIGNMYDHPDQWRERSPIEVDHLVGYNMAIRRTAFNRFEEHLRPYWQLFELDACLQVRSRGYKIIFDFMNVVNHFPTNTAYVGGREGDLRVKIYNGAYNLAFIHAKHTHWTLVPLRFSMQILVGKTGTPGLAAAIVSTLRFGRPLREMRILFRTWFSVLIGWRDGLRRRRFVSDS